jgi:hypothetical protein
MRVICLLAVAACGGAPPAAKPASPPQNSAAPAPAPESNDADKLLHGHPTTADFDALVQAFPSLSAARRSAIAALGTTRDAPIHVPSIEYEYTWVAKIACNGGEGKVSMQALTSGPSGQLDLLSFTCPDDASEHSAYFDFSDDPQEKQMQKELGGGN